MRQRAAAIAVTKKQPSEEIYFSAILDFIIRINNEQILVEIAALQKNPLIDVSFDKFSSSVVHIAVVADVKIIGAA